MDDFKDSKTALIADVDCTGDGKPLCDQNKVKGYPTILYGEYGNLDVYQGDRAYDGLKQFAAEKLGPICGPGTLDYCDAETRAKMERFLKMSLSKLEGKITRIVKDYEVELPKIRKVVKWQKEKA